MTRKGAPRSQRTEIGKRDRRNRERDDAIRKAAMSLARRGIWPAPPTVSERAGVSVSVVERASALLSDARREWERIAGRQHPQWRDPERAGQAATPPPTDEASLAAADTGADLKSAKATAKRQRKQIAELKQRVEQLEEQVRRLLMGVRPAEIEMLSKARTDKGPAGKTD